MGSAPMARARRSAGGCPATSPRVWPQVLWRARSGELAGGAPGLRARLRLLSSPRAERGGPGPRRPRAPGLDPDSRWPSPADGGCRGTGPRPGAGDRPPDLPADRRPPLPPAAGRLRAPGARPGGSAQAVLGQPLLMGRLGRSRRGSGVCARGPAIAGPAVAVAGPGPRWGPVARAFW